MLFSLRLLGGASLHGQNGPLTGPVVQPRRLGVLALLATSSTRAASRDRLATFLWPELSAERANHRLADAVYGLREALGKDAVRAAGGELLLNHEVIHTDVREFQEALERGNWERMISLYRGAFLDGFFVSDAPEFERWVEEERERLARSYARALEMLAEAREKEADWVGAVEWWRRLAAQDPYCSRVALRLMQALEAAGDRAAAIRHATLHAALLREEIGVEPDSQMTTLAERLRKELVLHGDGASSKATPCERSIAVLPFVNLSTDGGNEYLGDGLTDELRNALAQLEGLKVAARTSSHAFRDKNLDVRAIGDTLGVATVLEGSVRVSGNRLRITTQLVSTCDGYQLWSWAYDRELGDIFAVQEEIARAIVGTLQVRLTGGVDVSLVKGGTTDLEAHTLYLKGRYFWNKRTKAGLEKAVEYFGQAIERDPTYAQAYSGLADSYHLLGTFGFLPPPIAYARARPAAEQSVRLDETLAEAHVSLAVVLECDRNYIAAEQEYRRAIQLRPNYATAHHWYAYCLLCMGRVEEAVREVQHALRLDPLAPVINAATGHILYNRRDYDGAIEQLRQTIDLFPEFAWGWSYLGLAYAEQQRYEEAITVLRRAIDLAPENPEPLANLAFVQARRGQHGHARIILEQLKAWEDGEVNPLLIASICGALGERDAAFAWGLNAEWNTSPLFTGSEPRLDPLRSDPRFPQLLKRIGL